MKIGILGCGWLGLPLAEHLISNGYTVKGSTTSFEKLKLLENKSVEPHLIRLSPELSCEACDSFWDTDILLINIPPGRKRTDVVKYHTRQIKSLIAKLRSSSIPFVIFVSSTSVYPELSGIVNEDDTKSGEAGRESGNALLLSENLLRQEASFQTTIVRFGGLYGYDRNPARFLAGKKNLDRGKAPVNMIHRDDCIRILTQIIEQDIRGETFNAVSDGHPPRKMYYKTVARAAGFEPPIFKKDTDKPYKVVSNQKLKSLLNYQFRHPNPLDI
jgi:nucleoside-diphosphate-sugar epimerase